MSVIFMGVFLRTIEEYITHPEKSEYDKCQLVCDAISGMTESYLIKKHNEYKALESDIS